MSAVTSRRSDRTRVPLTPAHLDRLGNLADADHEYFTRADGRPEYRDRRILVVLAQGAALHWVDGRNGVRDLDVWTFYRQIDGQSFPAAKRETHADFGPSELGRQQYDFGAAGSAHRLAEYRRWDTFEGRRVDFLMRALPVPAGAGTEAAISVLQDWLAEGAAITSAMKPTPWWLAQKAVVMIAPASHRGQVVWPLEAAG